jgi:rhodanese-related sulfurtransferase
MHEISSKDVIDLIKNNPDLVIVDVRTQAEFESGHIKRSVNIDVSRPNFKEDINRLNKNTRYVVYCRSGNRSRFAAQIMEVLGFREVYDLGGGIVRNPELLSL